MQPVKLFSKGIVTGYRRGQRNQSPNHSLVKIEGKFSSVWNAEQSLCDVLPNVVLLAMPHSARAVALTPAKFFKLIFSQV